MRLFFSAVMISMVTLKACSQPTVKKSLHQNSTIKEVDTKKPNYYLDTITLGGGCYWCVEAVYEMLEGVESVESGFSGGILKNPSYYEVCSGKTGHAEVIQLVFDTGKIDLTDILKIFFTVHDPTTYNRQGADVGSQYRSVIFFRNEEQYSIANNMIQRLNEEDIFQKPIVTELTKFSVFYKAEKDHQDYYMLNKEKPYCKMVIQPKVDKIEKLFKGKLKNNY